MDKDKMFFITWSGSMSGKFQSKEQVLDWLRKTSGVMGACSTFKINEVGVDVDEYGWPLKKEDE